MADITNLEGFLGDIAEAIRTKKETTEPIAAENFDTEILSIETGVDTSDADAVASDIINGKTAYVDGEKITGNMDKADAATTYNLASIDETNGRLDNSFAYMLNA